MFCTDSADNIGMAMEKDVSLHRPRAALTLGSAAMFLRLLAPIIDINLPADPCMRILIFRCSWL